jgi:hypothetical protein
MLCAGGEVDAGGATLYLPCGWAVPVRASIVGVSLGKLHPFRHVVRASCIAALGRGMTVKG